MVPGAGAVGEAAAELFVEAVAGAIAARGRALVALTGGSAAPPIFAALKGAWWRARVAWPQVEFFYSDERAVSSTDPLSNHGLAEREFLGPLGIAKERVHRLRGEAQDQAAEALRAAAELRSVAAGSQAPTNGSPKLVSRPTEGPPRFDLILLGLGPDGHICSLFAGTDSAAERGEELVRAVAAPERVEPHVPTSPSRRQR